MASAQDNVALWKQFYEDQINIGYRNMGILRQVVQVEGDVEGINRTYPLIGIAKARRRYGGEPVVPNPPVTSNVVMSFTNWESTDAVSIVDEKNINNPTFFPRLALQQVDAIRALIEQLIINAFASAPTVDSNTVDPNNIDNGYRINGNGTAYTNAAGEAPLTVPGIARLKVMMDDMGIGMERYLYIPSIQWLGLSAIEQFTNTLYTGDYNLMAPGVMYSLLGFKILVGQVNPNGDLPATPGGGKYAFAFTTNTVQLNEDLSGPGARMWFFDNEQSWYFQAVLRAGAAAIRPSTLIKIACANPA